MFSGFPLQPWSFHLMNRKQSNSSTSSVNFFFRVRSVAGLAVFCKLGQLLHHAQLQAARLLQPQSRVAGLGEALPEGTQQPAACSVVERQTAVLIVQEGSHSLRRIRHKHRGLNAIVKQQIPAAGEKQTIKVLLLYSKQNYDFKVKKRSCTYPDGEGTLCKHHDELFSPSEPFELPVPYATPSL